MQKTVMQIFDLDRLNLYSPYKLWSKKTNSYVFMTDFGVQYRIEFADNHDIWKEGAYEFCILNENNKNSPNDPKVKETIQCVIEEFFLTNPDILLYQCETGDNRQAMRARLFLKWFNDYKNKERFCIKLSLIKDEDVDNYIALIVQKNNPALKYIINTFDDFVGFFTQKPE